MAEPRGRATAPEQRSPLPEREAAALRDQKRQAELSSQLKDEFLGLVAHELRAPLNTIIGWASLLVHQQLSPQEAQAAAEAIYRNAQLQSQLLSNLFDVASMSTGKLRLNIAPVDLATVLEGAIESLMPVARAKGITIETDIDRFAGAVSGDVGRLEQVAWKLLFHGISLTPTSGRIAISLRQVDSSARVDIHSERTNVPPEAILRLFDAAMEMQESALGPPAQLGPGLGVVRNLVELHGGTVTVEREDGGVTLRMELPRPTVIESSAATAVPEQSAAARKIEGARVLLVDDDADARVLLSAIVSNAGGQVRAVGTVREAVEAVHAFKPQVLVSDLALHNESGLDLIREIRAEEAKHGHHQLPAIALTAYAGADDRRRVMLAGYHVHLPKPAEPEELVTAIANLVAAASR